MLTRATAIAAVRVMAYRRGVELTEADEALLAGDSGQPSPAESERLRRVFSAAAEGFFYAAADGYHFADPDRIKERYGSTLRANYPEAGPAFLNFATSYWTLKLIIDEPSLADDRSAAIGFLNHLERTIGPLFFPTPGPMVIDPRLREADQRRVLEASGAPFDVEDFIRHNPILIRDRRGTGSGCFSAIVLSMGIVTAALLA